MFYGTPNEKIVLVEKIKKYSGRVRGCSISDQEERTKLHKNADLYFCKVNVLEKTL